MTLQDSYDKINSKYGDKLTPFLILSRACSIPETETNEIQIERLVKKKLKDEIATSEIKAIVRDLFRRYKAPKQYKESNFKNYI